MLNSRVDARDASSFGAMGILLVAFFICLYTLSYNGVFRVDDEHILAARAQSLALWGRLEEPQVYGNLRVRELAAFGDQATQIEPLQSVLGAGLYRLGTALGLGGAQALFALNIYATALAAGFVFAAVLSLGHSFRTALWCGALFGAGTMAWPYAGSYYRDALAMSGASLAFLGWSVVVAGEGRRWPGAALLCVGTAAGILTKNTIVALLPAFGLTAAAIGVAALRAKAAAPWRVFGIAAAIGLAGAVASVLIPSQGALARFSLAYYASLARYFIEGLGSEVLLPIVGPFVSPAKSIFLFSPPLLLAVVGIFLGWRRSWKVGLPALLFAGFLAVGQAFFYGERWAGSYGWGLRTMLPCLPALMIAGAPAVERLLDRSRRGGRALLPAVLALGGIVQLGGSWVDLRAVYAAWRETGLDPYAVPAAWEARFLAILPQLGRLADPASWSVAWMRLIRSGAAEAAAAPAAAAIAGLFSLAMLLHAGSATRTRLSRAVLIIGGLASVLPIFPTLWAYQRDPAFGGARPEFVQSAAYLEENATSGDLIAVDAYATPLWAYLMNRWESPVRWYSLPFEIPGSPGVEADSGCILPPMSVDLLFEAPQSGTRLFYVTSTDSPDYALGREVCRLDLAYELETAATFGAEGGAEVRVYPIP